MIWYVLLGLLAAFGLLCALWTMFGFVLPGSRRCGIMLLCSPEEEKNILRRLLWLRELGFLRCRIFLSGRTLTEMQRSRLQQRYGNIEFYDPAQPED